MARQRVRGPRWQHSIRGWLLASAMLAPHMLTAQRVVVSGRLDLAWADRVGAPGAQLVGSLRATDGSNYVIQFASQAGSPAQLRRLSGRLVRITGATLVPRQPSQSGSSTIMLADGVAALDNPANSMAFAPPSVTGSVAWVVVGCRFQDDPTTPVQPSFWTSMLGSSSPGLDHYWRELSGNALSLTGSQASVWVDLPLPRSAYVTGNSLDFTRLMSDCVAAADPGVYFPSFQGIVMQVNGGLPCPFGGECSFGFYQYFSFTTDNGQTRGYHTVLNTVAAATAQSVWAHEMGHTFGLAHSGTVGNDYNSHWDVMSFGQVCCTAPFSWVGIHTTAYYKFALGWIPAARVFTAVPGSNQQIVLERSALPISTTTRLLAMVPIASLPGQFYTVENRQVAGYDQTGGSYGLPTSNGVVIHQVIADGSNGLFWQVTPVDGDGNGDPNDAGGIWTTGETFTDDANGIVIRIDGPGSPSSVLVTIQNMVCPVDVSVVPSNGGTVAITSGGAVGACGRSVTVAATPNWGYAFVNWTEGGVNRSTNTAYTFTASAGRTLAANFAAQCAITVFANPSAGGTAVVTAGGASGTCGRSVTVTATPAVGYAFVNWTEGGVNRSTNTAYSFTASSGRTLVANFATKCTLTVNAGTGGTAAQTSGTATGDCGRSVIVTATPTGGNAFQGWSDGAIANPYTLTLNTSLTLTASFAVPCTVAVSANPGAGGTAVVTAGGASGTCGRSVTVTGTPASGYALVNWTEGGINQATAAVYSFVANADRTLVANFAVQCTMVVASTAGGAGAVTSGGASGACGRLVTVTATPSPGYLFISWSEAGAEVSIGPVLQLTVSSNRTVVPSFLSLVAVVIKGIDALLGTGAITSVEVSALDRVGNNNGRLDLADLLKALDDSGASLTSALEERLDRVLRRVQRDSLP